MSGNTIKQEEQEKQKPNGRSMLKKFSDFDFSITQENSMRFLPFMFYVSGLVILYIGNHHYGEKTIREIDSIQKEMKDLKADFYTLNAELSNKSIQSEVARMVSTTGLEELRIPPYRLKLVEKQQ
jgi:hypothetical protein